MRTITVKGVGAVSVRPDQTELCMELENLDLDYEVAMTKAASQIAELLGAFAGLGFEKSELKTTDFDVNMKYENVKDRFGNYSNVFKGYRVSHSLKLAFDLDASLIGRVLAAVASCKAKPELSIRFGIKNPGAVSAALLRSATENAKEKAGILCESAGVRLGALVSVDYSWGELAVYSRTRYAVQEECVCCSATPISGMEFEPDDIDARDSATFVWEIL